MAGTIVVWMSKHHPVRSQTLELQRLFPGCAVLVDTRSYSGADEIVRRFHSWGGTEMVVVAPLHVINELVLRGIRPIKAVMQRVASTSPHAEVRVRAFNNNERAYRFVKFQRYKHFNIELEDISPPPSAMAAEV